MPSKALLRPGELLAEVDRVPGSARDGLAASSIRAIVFARRDEVIHDLDDSGMIPWLEDRGIELIRGRGALDGERTVVAGDERLDGAARRSSSPRGRPPLLPPIDGLAEARPWTNREATTARGRYPTGC